MPAPYDPRVIERARELWTKQGLSPKQIVGELEYGELIGSQLELDVQEGRLPPEVSLPVHRSTINRWAKSYGWTPHWREARRKTNQKIEKAIAEGDPFPISGIRDPIWHLAVVAAQRYIMDNMPVSFSPPAQSDDKLVYLDHRPPEDKSADEFIGDIIYHVHKMLHPGPRVLERLRPIIIREMARKRYAREWFDNMDRPVPTPFDPSRYE